MQNDVPLAVYSFEHAAIREGRLKGLIRPGRETWTEDTVFNFGGHRFRVDSVLVADAATMRPEQAADAGFVPGDGLDERGKMFRWLERIRAPKLVAYYHLEPLGLESNTPLT